MIGIQTGTIDFEHHPYVQLSVAVKELNLSYYIGEALLCTLYIYIPINGNLIQVPLQQPSYGLLESPQTL